MAEFRDIEAKIHEQLYNNILLLTNVYPTTKEFDLVFKRDMFVKSNKAAFHQVVHYLLSALNVKLTTWPPYDIKTENKFRTEVLTCIDNLKFKYEDPGIPSIMASHLISPGGFSFAKFMLKLSQLVLREYLRRNVDDSILDNIKPSKSALSELHLKNLKEVTRNIEIGISQQVQALEAHWKHSNNKAKEIAREQKELTEKLHKTQKICNERKGLQSTTDHEVMNDKINQFQADLTNIKKFTSELKDCYELVSYLLSKKSVLEFSKSQLVKVPQKIQHLIESGSEELDLQQLFNSLQVLLQGLCLDLPNCNKLYLDEMNGIISKLIKRYETIEMRLDLNRANFLELASKINEVSHEKSNGTVQISGCHILLDTSE